MNFHKLVSLKLAQIPQHELLAGALQIDGATQKVIDSNRDLIPAVFQIETRLKTEALEKEGRVLNIPLKHQSSALAAINQDILSHFAPFPELLTDPDFNGLHITMGDIRRPVHVSEKDLQIDLKHIPLDAIVTDLIQLAGKIPAQTVLMDKITLTSTGIVLLCRGNGWIHYFRAQFNSILEANLGFGPSDAKWPKKTPDIIHCTLVRFKRRPTTLELDQLKAKLTQITRSLQIDPIEIPLSGIDLVAETHHLGGPSGTGFHPIQFLAFR